MLCLEWNQVSGSEQERRKPKDNASGPWFPCTTQPTETDKTVIYKITRVVGINNTSDTPCHKYDKGGEKPQIFYIAIFICIKTKWRTVLYDLSTEETCMIHTTNNQQSLMLANEFINQQKQKTASSRTFTLGRYSRNSWYNLIIDDYFQTFDKKQPQIHQYWTDHRIYDSTVSDSSFSQTWSYCRNV